MAPRVQNIPGVIFRQSTFLFVVLLLGISTVFFRQVLPTVWIVFDLLVVYLFFFCFYRLWLRWMNLSEKVIRLKIFWTALWIRVGYVLFSYLFYTYMTGQPFEFESADAMGYHYQGLRIAEYFRAGIFDITPLIYFEKFSSRGIMILMGAVYAVFFDSVLAFRAIVAVLGAWVCVMIYDLARRAFGLRVARLCAAIAVPAPPLIYYCGLHLKEAVILFLVVFFMNNADRLLRERRLSIRYPMLLVATLAVMFLFRNAMAVALFLSFMAALALTSSRVVLFSRRLVVAVLLVGSIGLLFAVDLASEAQSETMFFFTEKTTNLEQHMQLYASRGNIFATQAKRAIFAPLGFIGPIPTLVDTKQENIMMLAGSMFFRNAFGFFVILSLWYLFTAKLWRQHVFLIAVFFSWLFILSNSGYALQDRFHLVLAPLVILFGGYGISLADKKTMGYFQLYLLFLGAIVFAWNWFKLAGRGWI
ncbi:MAG: hypothetical protein C4548_03335 [Desulfobacteraceae bacterium]|jgi:hypothetical protein|nr:MAG: hypothetical protein C4548_03335 [Desulfobacteraceae bacterium]